ncbi:MAG: acetyl-CoA carboxylase biotin carboxyl carrier protein subunit [Actinomycetales bacterium]|nr:MAG: acetyl-CoA carboxylase biotin carboxyl carrier protein subunit [Actinomycetales bacterium]
MRLKVTVDGVDYDVAVEVEPEPRPALGGFVFSSTGSATSRSGPASPPGEAAGGGGGENALRAPIAGTVLQVKVAVGQEVAEGDTLIILEAMKMETEVTAPVSGTVKSIPVQVGSAVQGGDVLIDFE